MVRHVAVLLAAAFMLAAPASIAESTAIYLVPDTALGLVPKGGAEGGDALYCNGCDAIGFRNIQGSSENLDIGAGSTENPGDIALNFDVGRCTFIYDGHKNLLARFCPDRIQFYRKVVGYEAPKKGRGWWRWGRRCRHCRFLSRSGRR